MLKLPFEGNGFVAGSCDYPGRACQWNVDGENTGVLWFWAGLRAAIQKQFDA